MKIQSIQALRAIAALMVVVLHTAIIFSPADKARLFWWPGFSDFGWLGVSLFFVISGFIVASVVSKPDFSTGSFLWHRFWRIYPLYWIVMLAGLYFYYERNWFAHAIQHLGPIGMTKSALIFPLEDHPFWEPGWSLEHEVLFYVIAALVVPFLGLRALAVLLFALAGIGMTFNPGWDYHLFAAPQFYFAAGIVAYLFRNSSYRVASPIAVAGLALAYGHFYGFVHLPVWATVVSFGVGCAALIVALLDAERRGWKVPWVLVVIGNASFSLYLWHWLIVPLTSRWVAAYGGPPEMWRWIIVAVSIAVAIPSQRIIEEFFNDFSHGRLKFQRQGKRQIKPAE